jgi:dCTP deaminase
MSATAVENIHSKIRNSGLLSQEEYETLFDEVKDASACLSDRAIERCLKQGRLHISPYEPENLSNSSYDVTLGRYFYREDNDPIAPRLFNPYDPDHVKRVWGDSIRCEEAENVGSWRMRFGLPELVNIPDDEYLIVINPGETILAHTKEFIGGSDNCLTTMMKARSSWGRCFISVCMCAGWGDIGYHNRWTMEIHNRSPRYQIPLVVGRRIAQIIFLATEGTDNLYGVSGKYQSPASHEEMERKWTPDRMLPKMYNDREVRERSKK